MSSKGSGWIGDILKILVVIVLGVFGITKGKS